MSGKRGETTTSVPIERVTIVSDRAFDDVLEGVYSGLGRTADLGGLIARWTSTADVDDFDELIAGVAGSSGLIEFLTLDLGAVLEKRLRGGGYRMLRIVAGNPVTMSKMAAFVPDVGSYAPVSILIAERPDGVHLAYDTVSSAIAVYDSAEASAVAGNLDAEVLKLLRRAAAG